MKTHNRILLHCLCCGSVAHAEPEDAIPSCCGKRMTNTAAETVVEDDNDLPQNCVGTHGGEAPRAKIQQVPR